MPTKEPHPQRALQRKHRNMFSAGLRNNRMHERGSQKILSSAGTGLRWWAGIIFSLLLLNLLANIIFAWFGGGPDAVKAGLNFQYLVVLESRYPIIFWPVASVLVGAALFGAVLLAFDLWRKMHTRDTQRSIYLQAVQETYPTMSLVIDPSLNITLPPDVYQRLSYQYAADDELDGQNQPTKMQVRYIPEALDKRQSVCMILVGAPGGGKTTFLRQSMVYLAKQAKENGQSSLPVYISLPAFVECIKKDALNAVQEYLKETDALLTSKEIAGYAGDIQDAVAGGRVFLFLDSLDEVEPGSRDLVINWILRQSRSMTVNGALVVGTRRTGYEAGAFQVLDEEMASYQKFAECEVQEMDHAIRSSLAVDLFDPLLEQAIKFDPRVRMLPKPVSTDFVQLVEQTPETETLLGGNPLLFSLAAYLYVQGERESLPESRVVLYNIFIESLLTKVVKKRQESEPKAGKYGLMRETVQVLGEVSLWILKNQEDTSTITGGNLANALRAICDELRLSSDPNIMEPWVIDSGVFVPERLQQRQNIQQRAQQYAFRHHTFQEYLAAIALGRRLMLASMQESTWTLLREKRFVRQWYEPMRMFAGVLMLFGNDEPAAKNLAMQWMQELEQIVADTSHADHHAAVELAVASLPEIPQIAATGTAFPVKQFLDDWAITLLDAAQNQQQEWIKRFQDLAAGIAILPREYVEPAVQQLQQALHNGKSPSAQKAAAQSMERLGNLVTDLIPLTNLMQKGRDREAKVAAAHTLAMLEQYDAVQGERKHTGHPVLQQGLQSQDAEQAQIIAAGLYGAGEEARELMLLAVDQHCNAETRRLGTIALGSLGPAVRKIVADLSNDPDPDIAATALVILDTLGGSKEEWDTKLRQLAQQDPSVLKQMQSTLPPSLRRLGYRVSIFNGVEVILPPMKVIPAGPFLMGSTKKDKLAYKWEFPQRTVILEAYQIGTYPLTVAEYACFARATQRKMPPDMTLPDEQWVAAAWRKKTLTWEIQRTQRSDHPVVGVTWQDALAYVQWLAKVTGKAYRLPTEAEWEKAARGTDGRVYPWGNTWDNSKANADGNPGMTTPVGSYPQGASLYGCLDMCGNVWEWTSTIFKPYPYQAGDGRENLTDTQENRVLRGGSWYSYPQNSRAAYRNNYGIGYFYYNFGFRVACVAAG